MKKVVVVLLFCVSVFLNSYSQTKQESIKELFHLMQKDLAIDRTITSMVPSLLKMSLRNDSTITETERNKLNSKLQIAKDLSTKMQTEEMALYDKYFSENEIMDLIEFYKTPAGLRLIELTPKIQNDLMLIVQQKYMQEILKMVISMKEQ
jgi:hypothetical protein